MAIDTVSERFGMLDGLLPYPSSSITRGSRLLFLDLFGIAPVITASGLRTIDIEAEDRSPSLDSESRTFTVEIESRTYTVSA